MLITPGYLAEQRRLHALGGYGEHGERWADIVARLCCDLRAHDVLDYGAGAGGLARRLGECGFFVFEYDPAVKGKDQRPQPADLVVCTDVLEHIEPALLRDVLSHIRKLTRVALFAVISTRPAGKKLSDGRNAHLIVESDQWWRNRMDEFFRVKRVWRSSGEEWIVFMRPRVG